MAERLAKIQSRIRTKASSQRMSRNRTQARDSVEYVPPDADMGMYFSPIELNYPNTPNPLPPTNQGSNDRAYDLPGSSEVYNMQTRRVVSQNNQGEQVNQKPACTAATKVQVTVVLVVLTIALSALVITIFGLPGGKFKFEIHND